MRSRAGGSIVRAPRSVVAYHGCSDDAAHRILSEQRFIPSENSYDWLGAGVYFWEYGPFRAAEWARRRFGPDAAVLQATIRLGRCLNLLDPFYYANLQAAYRVIVTDMRGSISHLPANRARTHHLDRLVIEACCRRQIAIGETPYATVRGCFPEGDPVFPGSKILRETHVQVSVRDDSCISDVRVVSLEQIEKSSEGTEP